MLDNIKTLTSRKKTQILAQKSPMSVVYLYHQTLFNLSSATLLQFFNSKTIAHHFTLFIVAHKSRFNQVPDVGIPR